MTSPSGPRDVFSTTRVQTLRKYKLSMTQRIHTKGGKDKVGKEKDIKREADIFSVSFHKCLYKKVLDTKKWQMKFKG